MNRTGRSPLTLLLALAVAGGIGVTLKPFREWRAERVSVTSTTQKMLERQWGFAKDFAAKADRDPSFKYAYRSLMLRISTAELVRTWQGLGYRVDVPADLPVELQNAHLIAAGRVRSDMDRLLLRNLEWRYQEILGTISLDAAPERMTAR
jgi:hypothetical protein